MKILMLVDEEFYPKIGGSALEQWEFARRAVERGHEVVVFTPRKVGQVRYESVEGVRVHRPIRSRFYAGSDWSTFRVLWAVLCNVVLFLYGLAWLRSHLPTVIYSTSYVTDGAGKALGWFLDVPMFNYIQSIPSTRNRSIWLLRTYESVVFDFLLGDVVFCKTNAVRDRVELDARNDPVIHRVPPTFNSSKVRRIAGSVDVDAVREEYGDSDVLLGFVGRFVPVKDLPATVDLLAELPDRYSLVLVGDGPEYSTVERLVRERGLADRVTFAGELEHEDALSVIAAVDGLILTSREEVDPTVVYEALAFGKPVFGTPVGTLTETDHPNLTVGPIGSLPGLIRDTTFDGDSVEVDETVVSRYDVGQFVETVLGAMRTRAHEAGVAVTPSRCSETDS